LDGGSVHGACVVAASLERDGAALVLAPAKAVDEQAAGNGEGPGQHLGTDDETTAGAVDLQHRVLKEVVRPTGVAARAEQVPAKARGQRVVELGEGSIVAARVALHGGVGPLAFDVAGAVEASRPDSGRRRAPFSGERHFGRQPGQRGHEGQ